MNKKSVTFGRRWIVIPFLAAALLLALAGRAQAVEIGTGGVIAAGETINDDVVLSGQNVRMDGTVNGTLVVSGENVTVNGTVNGDVVLWGNTATINGVINGNIYAAGATLNLNGPVKGTAFLASATTTFGPEASVERNVFYGGYSLATQPGSKVGTDLLSATYQTSLAGTVGRDVLAAAGAVELSGQVGRNMKIEVSKPADRAVPAYPQYFGPGVTVRTLPTGLRVAPTASIGGKLTYTSSVNQDSAIQAKAVGGQEYIFRAEPTTSTSRPSGRTTIVNAWLNSIVSAGRNFLTLMVLGSLAFAFLPTPATRVVQQAREKTLPAAGWGFVVFCVAIALIVVIALVLLIAGILLGVVTFGGLARVVFGVGFSGLGLASSGFWFLVAYGSKLVVAVLVGQLILRALAPRYADNRILGLAIGVVIYVVLRDLTGIVPVAGPAFGWLLGVAVTLVGLGAMWLAFREWRTASRPAAVPSITPAAPPTA